MTPDERQTTSCLLIIFPAPRPRRPPPDSLVGWRVNGGAGEEDAEASAGRNQIGDGEGK
nr:unnamed protein product [Digitaria exilis]